MNLGQPRSIPYVPDWLISRCRCHSEYVQIERSHLAQLDWALTNLEGKTSSKGKSGDKGEVNVWYLCYQAIHFWYHLEPDTKGLKSLFFGAGERHFVFNCSDIQWESALSRRGCLSEDRRGPEWGLQHLEFQWRQLHSSQWESSQSQCDWDQLDKEGNRGDTSIWISKLPMWVNVDLYRARNDGRMRKKGPGKTKLGNRELWKSIGLLRGSITILMLLENLCEYIDLDINLLRA